MKKIRSFFLLVAILLGITSAIYLTSPAIAGDAILIKIQPQFKDKNLMGFYVDPPTVYVKMNTIVVWLSGVPNNDVQIVFQEGKTCRDVSANPNMKHPGFFLDSKNCYVTSFLPHAATSTLQFSQLGVYKYEVVTEDLKMKAKGKIIVAQ